MAGTNKPRNLLTLSTGLGALFSRGARRVRLASLTGLACWAAFAQPAVAIAGDELAPLRDQLRYFEAEYPADLEKSYRAVLHQYFSARAQDFIASVNGLSSMAATDWKSLTGVRRQWDERSSTSGAEIGAESAVLFAIDLDNIRRLEGRIGLARADLEQVTMLIEGVCSPEGMSFARESLRPEALFPAPHFVYDPVRGAAAHPTASFEIHFGLDSGEIGYDLYQDSFRRSEDGRPILDPLDQIAERAGNHLVESQGASGFEAYAIRAGVRALAGLFRRILDKDLDEEQRDLVDRINSAIARAITDLGRRSDALIAETCAESFPSELSASVRGALEGDGGIQAVAAAARREREEREAEFRFLREIYLQHLQRSMTTIGTLTEAFVGRIDERLSSGVALQREMHAFLEHRLAAPLGAIGELRSGSASLRWGSSSIPVSDSYGLAASIRYSLWALVLEGDERFMDFGGERPDPFWSALRDSIVAEGLVQ